MRQPINKLAFAAHACAMRGRNVQQAGMSRLAETRFHVVDSGQLEPAERVLVAVVDFYIERGPITDDVTNLLSQAVSLCAREWAQTSQPGTPPAKPEYWYMKGDME